jgi:hypothetical protein
MNALNKSSVRSVKLFLCAMLCLASGRILHAQNVPPSITAQPTNQTVIVGQSATFSVTATGSPTLRYQWSFNGTNIVGATNLAVSEFVTSKPGINTLQG